MDEATVAAALAAKNTPEVPGAPELPPQPSDGEVNQQFLDKMTPEELFTKNQLLDYLQVPTHQRHSPIVDNYILTVYQWARDNAQTGDINQLLRIISEQEQHLGSRLKPDRLQKLAEYVKINKMRQQLFDKERLLYG